MKLADKSANFGTQVLRDVLHDMLCIKSLITPLNVEQIYPKN